MAQEQCESPGRNKERQRPADDEFRQGESVFIHIGVLLVCRGVNLIIDKSNMLCYTHRMLDNCPQYRTIPELL